MSRLRVLLADDHAVVLEGLRSLLARDAGIEVVGCVTDGLSACEQAVALAPDVVVMDLSLPKLNGAQATRRIRRECPGVKVLVLNVHQERGYLRNLLDAGATGYVLKRSAAGDLVRAVRTVAEGGMFLDPSRVSGSLADVVRGGRGSPTAVGDLSEREADVLRLIAAGLSNREIAADLDISVKTMETYRARSMEKLGFQSRADIVRYAVQRGWLDDV